MATLESAECLSSLFDGTQPDKLNEPRGGTMVVTFRDEDGKLPEEKQSENQHILCSVSV